jgi:ribosomal protein L15
MRLAVEVREETLDIIIIFSFFNLFLCFSVRDGVKLLGNGHESFDKPIHIEVSRASNTAIEAIEVI